MGNTVLNDVFGNTTPNNESAENIETQKPFDKPIEKNGSAAYLETKKPVDLKPEQTESKINGFEPANWQLAQERARQNSVFKFNEQEEISQIKLNFGKKIQEFGIYGPGIYLFFTFSKKIIFLFIILMVISLIPTIYNVSVGIGYDDKQNSILKGVSKLSIGNLLPNKGQKYSSLTDKLMNAIPTFIMSLLFFAFYLYWNKKSQVQVQNLKKTTKMICQSTVEVYKFPKDMTQNQLRQYMQRYGKIKEISQVKKSNERIKYCRKIYKIYQQISQIKLQAANQPIERDNQIQKQKIIKQKEQNLKKKLQELYRQLQHEEKNSSKEIIKFFVTFQSQQVRQKVVETFLPYNKSRLLCFKEKYPEQLKDQTGGQVYVQACRTEPDGIIWQNMHLTLKSRLIRKLIQLFVITITIELCSLSIIFMNVLNPPITTSQIYSQNYTQISIMGVEDQSVVRSWCLYNNELLQKQPESNFAQLCNKYLTSTGIRVLISIGVAIGILIIKHILKLTVVYTTKFIRFQNYSQQISYTAYWLSYTNFMSTVVTAILMQSNFDGFSYKEIVKDFSDNQNIQANLKEMNSFQDTDSGWYLDVGYNIWVTWLILAIIPPIIILFLGYPYNKILRQIAKRQIIQVKMEQYLMPSQFEISYHYADLSTFIWTGFVLSPGMPSLIILTGFGLIIRYFCLKFIFIRFSKIPKPLDENLNRILNIPLHYALIFHLIMAIWMYGVNEFFDHSDSFLHDQLYSANDSGFTKIWLILIKRCVDSWYLTALLVFYIFYFYLWSILRIIYNKCTGKTNNQQNKDQAQFKQTKNTQENGQEKEVKDSQMIPKMKSFRIQSNPDYYDILAMQTMKK